MGTGFSYVESNDQLTKTNEQIAKDLMVCIQEFYKKLPRFGKTPTYILAESYGGKMTVEFANIWYQVRNEISMLYKYGFLYIKLNIKLILFVLFLYDKEQRKGNIKSNFKGIGLIDSLIDSDAMFTSRSQYLFNFVSIDISHYFMSFYLIFEICTHASNIIDKHIILQMLSYNGILNFCQDCSS